MPADVSGPPAHSLADPLPSEPEDYGEPDEELFDDMIPDVPSPGPANQINQINQANQINQEFESPLTTQSLSASSISGSDGAGGSAAGSTAGGRAAGGSVAGSGTSVLADGKEANYKRYTVYELEKHWGAVIEDYNTIDAMMGGYLRLASVQVGEYTQSPFPVTVVFPASLSHFFDSRKDSFLQSLQEYLEIVLQRTIDLEIRFDDSNKSEEMRRIERQSLGVEQIFQEDVKREPVLKKLVEIFEAERRLTQREKKKTS